MLMMWSEVASIREVTVRSKDACFFCLVLFLSEIYFRGTKAVSYFTGDNFCFIIIKTPL